MTRITCSWCHSLNRAENRWCNVCGHSAWLARCDCDCIKCVGLYSEQHIKTSLPPPKASEVEPLDLPDAITRSLTHEPKKG